MEETSGHPDYTVSISVIGLGYVGLPLAKLLVDSGFHVTGIDVDKRKIVQLLTGISYISDLTNEDIESLMKSGRFSCDDSFEPITKSNVIIICVPTPLTEEGQPDLSYVMNVSSSISQFLRPSQLVILESSTFPGTTEEHMVPILEQSGLSAGSDFFVAYSPERINPGDTFDIHKIPKVVGGLNDESTRLAVELYKKAFDQVVVVSSIKIAELTKLLENTQRFINISLMNELAMICDKWKINLWEAIDAATTKPYGFTPYYPGPGVGGHCIPVDPLYLEWFAQQSGSSLGFITLSQKINDMMPEYVVQRIIRLCKTPQAKILLVGLTYKPDVNDLRESPALQILLQLRSLGYEVDYHDPLVKMIPLDTYRINSVALTQNVLHEYDVIAILTNHSQVDYDMIKDHARAVLDTRNVFRTSSAKANIETL